MKFYNTHIYSNKKLFNEYRLDLKLREEVEIEVKKWKSKNAIQKKLKSELSDSIGMHHCKLTNSGRKAILIALNLLNAKGKKVAVASVTHHSLLDSIILAKAKPVFLDIDIKNLNIVSKELENKLRGVNILLLPHMFSTSPDLPVIVEICKTKNIALIEDISQIFGEEGNYGYFGDFVVLSMSPYKPVSAPFMSAGAIFWNKDREFPIPEEKLSKKHLAHLLVKLKYLSAIMKGFQEVNSFYRTNLKDLPIKIPYVGKSAQEFPILTSKKEELEKELLRVKIPLERPYTPLHILYGAKEKICPQSLFYFKQALHLPVFPDMTITEASYIVKVIKSFFKRRI
ncbi:MAG: DegT/DnrJ/EryC1/StrS family aminotransferase [Elusimicrobiota bacterium]